MGCKIKSTRTFIKMKYLSKDFKYKNIKYKRVSSNKKVRTVYIFLAADYGNMGDIAITYAQKKFIEEKLKGEYLIKEIPLSKTYDAVRKLDISEDDIITIVGGGNMGNRYEWIEEARRFVIKKFKSNKIISFPQTFEFNNTNIGKESLKRTKETYNKHNNLYIFAREENSYCNMIKYFKKEKTFLVPDIVFYLKGKFDKINKDEEIGICFRNDGEKIIKDECKEKIFKLLKNHKIYEFDTHIGDENLIYQKRYEELQNFIEKISKMKLVITDRLHGMIFSYITNTPCIVFDNSNHKILSTYSTWLKDCNSILLLNEFDEKLINQFLQKIDKNKDSINYEKLNYEKLELILNK